MPAGKTDAVHAAYVAGLQLLARRELSEVEVRRRLERRGHNPQALDEAVTRLLAERAIDDERTAAAIARTEASVRRHGRLRARQRIEQAGIAAPTARRAVEDVFAQTDPDAFLEQSLARRLRGRKAVAGEAEFRRLYRYLIGQGFEPDRVIKALKARSVK